MTNIYPPFIVAVNLLLEVELNPKNQRQRQRHRRFSAPDQVGPSRKSAVAPLRRWRSLIAVRREKDEALIRPIKLPHNDTIDTGWGWGGMND